MPVLFDATANRRAYRELARQQISRFLEVYVDTPLETCVGRDPKAIYRQARSGQLSAVPGMQADYEPPRNPDLVVHGDRDDMEVAAHGLMAIMVARGYLEAGAGGT